MITFKHNTPDLSIPFADVLNVDTIQSLKDGLGMMGMRFTGKPTKAHIVRTFDNYVKEFINPFIQKGACVSQRISFGNSAF